ncbi:hypothetical protein [Staphylococcus phage vB_StaM_SA1]|nr:hypothetical protein [Staphylococcus phage vB_StaM_SA1]
MKDIYTIKLLGKMEQYSTLMEDDGMPANIIYYKDSIIIEFENRPFTGILKKDIEFELKDILDHSKFIVKEIEEDDEYEKVYKYLKKNVAYSYSYVNNKFNFLTWKKFDAFLKDEMEYK